MAYRVPPVLPVPPHYAEALAVCMAAKPLQHQDELTALLTWRDQLYPPSPLRVIVEIGSYRGGTLELWARLATDLVVSIDLPDTDFYGPAHDLSAMEMRNGDFAARFPHVHGILSDSHDPATVYHLEQLLAGRPIDLLFIDGDHSYAGVSADYSMYAPLVRPGGIIAFHDAATVPTRAANTGIDVRPFFLTLPPPRFMFHAGADWGGIGAIVKPG